MQGTRIADDGLARVNPTSANLTTSREAHLADTTASDSTQSTQTNTNANGNGAEGESNGSFSRTRTIDTARQSLPCPLHSDTGSSEDASGALSAAPTPLERPQKLTLAQRMGLVARPPKRLSPMEWEHVRQQSAQRQDSLQPCAICREELSVGEQILLSCSHTFHKACLVR